MKNQIAEINARNKYLEEKLEEKNSVLFLLLLINYFIFQWDLANLNNIENKGNLRDYNKYIINESMRILVYFLLKKYLLIYLQIENKISGWFTIYINKYDEGKKIKKIKWRCK